MKIVKSTDSFCSDIWRVMDGIKTVAVCYTEAEAEVCKEALEKHKAEKRMGRKPHVVSCMQVNKA